MSESEKSASEALLLTLKQKVLRGQYKEGVLIARAALKKYPKNFICLYQYAKLLGDWADELPLKKQKVLKQEATKILKGLTSRLAGKSVELRFGISLNYYYQRNAFQQMYEYGKRFAQSDKEKSYYAQGLAAALIAYDCSSQGKQRSAITWAHKSIRAWKKYSLESEKYYFAHYSYAKALAVSGDKKAALKALKKAAQLSKRSLSNWEFKDVLDLINA